MSWDSGHSSYEGCVQISSREQERPRSAPSHALKTAGPFVPDILPQRLHQRQKTPHWGGSSAKACQINEDLPAPSSPEIPGSPVRTWSPSLQHVARFQQQGRVCTLSEGNPEWQLCRRNGDRARTGSSTWYRHHGQLEPSSYGDTCCPDVREDLHQPYRGTFQRSISLSALLQMPCEIQSSASKGSLPLKSCMLRACKRCSDLIKLDFIISVVQPVWCWWANTTGVNTAMCKWLISTPPTSKRH